MEHWQPLKLSSSLRPVLEEEEIEILLHESTSIYEGDKATDYEHGMLFLTNLRILFVEKRHDAPRAIALELSKVRQISKKNSLFSSQKLHIELHASPTYLRIAFNKSGRDEFHEKLTRQLEKKTWEIIASKKQPKQQAPTVFSSSVAAGVGGLMRKVASENAKTQQTMTEAFSDLKSLMDKARELVELAERFSESQKKQQQQSPNNNSGDENSENAEFNSWLISLGIASPVTKKSAGALYHQELARQIADFLQKPLEKSPAAMITLTDAYCLYNRARGTDLISPEDLYRACALFDDLRLGMTLRKFDSGVLVIQSKQQSDDEIAKKILALIAQLAATSSNTNANNSNDNMYNNYNYNYNYFITEVDLAQRMGISIVLAREQLLAAERKEYLCRDETLEGIRFYKNFFVDV